MSTNFPASLDSFTNPAGSDDLSASIGGRTHAAMHADINDGMEAVQAAMGAGLANLPVGSWPAADQNFKAWNYDPQQQTTSATMTAGTLQVWKVRLPATTVTNVCVFAATTAAPTTAYSALYTGVAGGSLLSQSANQSGLFGTFGLKSLPLAAPQVVAAGVYYLAFWFTGTSPSLGCGPASGAYNIGLAATVARFGTANTGLTTTAPATLGTIAAAGSCVWSAAS